MAVKYQILRMETIGTPPVIMDGQPFTVLDPALAAAHAKVMSRQLGEKLCVKPVIDDEWREREAERFANGQYRQLPWAHMDWWTSNQAYTIWKDHFPHASLEKPGWVAFTKNEEDGAKDKQTLLRPGAYLNRFFERPLEVYGVREKGLVEQFMKMYGPIDIRFATTDKEVIQVYESLNTCMTGKRWPKGIHPATVYLAGDLQVAYIGDLEAGRVSARTVVWPERKLHSRVYGDIARLTQGLQRLDYKWGAPIGAKIKRIELRALKFNGADAPTGCFLVPYIDKKNQAGGGHLSVKDAGEHLFICDDGEPGSHHAGMADGTSGLYVPREDEYPTFTCDRCHAKGLRKAHQVFDRDPGDEEDEDNEPIMWCGKCVANYSQACSYSGNRFSTNVEMVDVGNDVWAKYYADIYAERCDGNGGLYARDEIYEVWLSDKVRKMWSGAYINDHDIEIRSSVLTERHFKRTDAVYVHTRFGDKEQCAKWELTHRAFQCDGCDSNWVLEHRHQSFNDDRLFCPHCAQKIAMGKTPVSKSRMEFENIRDQIKLPLIAAE